MGKTRREVGTGKAVRLLLWLIMLENLFVFMPNLGLWAFQDNFHRFCAVRNLYGVV